MRGHPVLSLLNIPGKLRIGFIQHRQYPNASICLLNQKNYFGNPWRRRIYEIRDGESELNIYLPLYCLFLRLLHSLHQPASPSYPPRFL